MNQTNQDEILSGVHCGVTNCAFNESGRLCHAKHIQVANSVQNGTTKVDTFCGTFLAKAGSEPLGRH